MRNKLVPRFIATIIFAFFYFQFSNADSNWSFAKEGNKVILIRHSIAPGGGDPEGFKINDCKTQRNLNQAGIEQSKRIGNLFKDKNIPIDQVLSSQWCRCKDTAKYAFQNFQEFSALNSTFQSPFDKNEPKQVTEIINLIKNWNGKGKNLVLITHYSIITSLTSAVPSSGEIVIIDKNFEVIGTIATD